MRLKFIGAAAIFIATAACTGAAQAACSVTYSFTSGTTAVASQINTNFSDLYTCAAPLASPSFTGTVGIGTTALTTLDTAGGMMRVQGGVSYGTVPSSGKGLELGYDTSTDTARILAFQRPSTGYKVLQLDGSTLNLNLNSGGKVGIGPVAPTGVLVVSTSNNASGFNVPAASMALVHNSNATAIGGQASPPGLVIVRDKSSAVASGEMLGGISWNARYDFEDRAGYANIVAIATSSGTADLSFNVSVSALTPQEAMHISGAGTTFIGSGGTCTINGSGSCTSDARLKRNIRKISGADALSRLSKISGISYNWADPALDQKQNVGVLAQSVRQVYPQLVGTTDMRFLGKKGNYYTVNYAGLTAPLISAVNELNRRVNAVQASVIAMDRMPKLEAASVPRQSVQGSMAQVMRFIESLQHSNDQQAIEIKSLRQEITELRRRTRIQTASSTISDVLLK